MDLMRAAGAAFGEFSKLIPRVWRLARELFHEVTGFVFLALALWFILGNQGLIRTLQSLEEKPDSMPQLLVVLLFVLMFGGFGISSFLRARRISRGQK
jgi:hypothetical protein